MNARPGESPRPPAPAVADDTGHGIIRESLALDRERVALAARRAPWSWRTGRTGGKPTTQTADPM